MAKYPQASDVYECQLYPGQRCRVLHVVNAQVTFQWLGDYARLEPQVAPVNRFVVDFRPSSTTGGVPADSSPPGRGR